MSTPATDRLFYLYFYAPLAFLGLAAGFFASRHLCRRRGKGAAGLALLTFLPTTFVSYFAILLTSGWYGNAGKFILLYLFILLPPFWLGWVLALPFTRVAPKNP